MQIHDYSVLFTALYANLCRPGAKSEEEAHGYVRLALAYMNTNNMALAESAVADGLEMDPYSSELAELKGKIDRYKVGSQTKLKDDAEAVLSVGEDTRLSVFATSLSKLDPAATEHALQVVRHRSAEGSAPCAAYLKEHGYLTQARLCTPP